MRSSRSGGLLASLTLVVLLAAVPAAQAKRPAKPWKVRDIRVPAKPPVVTGSVTTSFVAGSLRPDQRYEVRLTSGGHGDFCSAGYAVRLKQRVRPGSRVTVVFEPGDQRARQGVTGSTYPLPRFCAGVAGVEIVRADAANTITPAGFRLLKLVPDRYYPQLPLGTPVKISVLDGSAINVTSSGRPDRSMPVTGTLRGVIPDPFRPNLDVAVGSMTGALRLSSLRIDPLCAGTGPFPTQFPVVAGGPSNLLLKASGEDVLTLALAVDRLSLAGCAAPATPSPATVVLTGKVTKENSLANLPMSGSVPGVPIADGVTADVTVGLVLNVAVGDSG